MAAGLKEEELLCCELPKHGHVPTVVPDAKRHLDLGGLAVRVLGVLGEWLRGFANKDHTNTDPNPRVSGRPIATGHSSPHLQGRGKAGGRCRTCTID